MPPAEVLRPRSFFSLAAHLRGIPREGRSDVSDFRGQGGEELVIGVSPSDAGALVRGSTYLFDQQIARFFSTLDPIRTRSSTRG